MSLTRTEKIQYYQALKERLKRQARMSLLSFTKATFPSFEPAGFHKYYYNVLTEFAFGKVQKLMVLIMYYTQKSSENLKALICH